jgi:hypothetical protein
MNKLACILLSFLTLLYVPMAGGQVVAKGAVTIIGTMTIGPSPAQGGGGGTVPVILFTDLVDGPNTGGENNNGAVLSIYGKGFGATQGTSTVTVGGGAVAVVKQWCAGCAHDARWDKIAVAIGSAAVTGTIVVTVGSTASACGEDAGQTCQFTVRTGGLHYISATGSDVAAGDFATPWATPRHALLTMANSDIVYFKDTVTFATDDGTGWHTVVNIGNTAVQGASATSHAAFVAYPGTTVIIGAFTGAPDPIYGIRWSNAEPFWVIAGFTLRAQSAATSNETGSATRFVDNIYNCENGDGATGCMDIAGGGATSGPWHVYGNTAHNISLNIAGGSSKQYHSFYFTTDSNHVFFGWNSNDTASKSCRDLQFHSSPAGAGTGNDQFDLHIHDNYFHDNPCDGINMATIDPSKGTVELYNNVLVHNGKGPCPPDGCANFTGIFFPGTLNAGPAPSGTVLVYNNTLYDNGNGMNAFGNGAFGIMAGSSPNTIIQFTNNIVYQLSAATEPYIQSGSTAASISCTLGKNVWFGNGAEPSPCTGGTNADPLFVNIGTNDYHQQTGGSGINAGCAATCSARDLDAVLRPQGAAIDAGAYERAN